MSKLALFIKTKTKPGKRDEVRALWEEHLKPRAAANEAQELYFFCEDENDPNTFYLFEIYNNKAAFGENSEASWFADYMAKVGPLLEGQPNFGMASPYWAKGFKI